MTNPEPIQLTLAEARRLAVMAQGLAGPRPEATAAGMLEIFRRLRCVQIDPIRAVERTQLLVLWSRLGPFDPALLDQIQQEERAIFEGWAHAASFVLTEDYPLHAHWMRGHEGGGEWGERVRDWMAANDALRLHILDRLATDGPLETGEFEDIAAVNWESTGWNTGRNVTRMLDFLNGQGELLSVGRRGNNKIWHLLDRWLPERANHDPWPRAQVVQTTIEHSLRALGVATTRQIKNHFLRNRYPEMDIHLTALQADGTIVPVQIVPGQIIPGQIEGEDAAQKWDQGKWDQDWYIHRDRLPLLELIRGDDWHPRTVFLSPFDNLICDRERTELLWDFYFRIEIYVPKAKREYGYYVLPILHGDQIIGRMDSKFDRKKGVYNIHALYAEEAFPATVESGQAIAHSLAELAKFIGAKEVQLGDGIPDPWRNALEQKLN